MDCRSAFAGIDANIKLNGSDIVVTLSESIAFNAALSGAFFRTATTVPRLIFTQR